MDNVNSTRSIQDSSVTIGISNAKEAMDNLERAGKELAGEFFGHFLEKKLS